MSVWALIQTGNSILLPTSESVRDLWAKMSPRHSRRSACRGSVTADDSPTCSTMLTSRPTPVGLVAQFRSIPQFDTLIQERR